MIRNVDAARSQAQRRPRCAVAANRGSQWFYRLFLASGLPFSLGLGSPRAPSQATDRPSDFGLPTVSDVRGTSACSSPLDACPNSGRLAIRRSCWRRLSNSCKAQTRSSGVEKRRQSSGERAANSQQPRPPPESLIPGFRVRDRSLSRARRTLGNRSPLGNAVLETGHPSPDSGDCVQYSVPRRTAPRESGEMTASKAGEHATARNGTVLQSRWRLENQ